MAWALLAVGVLLWAVCWVVADASAKRAEQLERTAVRVPGVVAVRRSVHRAHRRPG
jgi:hypothetical protein